MRPRPQFEIRISGRPAHLGIRTIIAGILNVTPDSFSDGGLYLETSHAVQHAREMARQGADWIDVGGESARPGSCPVEPEEELRRVLPAIRSIRRSMPRLPISIDTTKAIVAEQALRAGANIVNDVSGLRFDPRIADVVRRFHAPLILMHLRGRPATMQRGPFARSIVRSLSRGLNWSIRRAMSLGVPHSQLIIDPGLGFGKTRLQNFQILARLDLLRRFGLPVLVGASRKSFIRAVVAGEPLRLSHSEGTGQLRTTTSGEAGPRRRKYRELRQKTTVPADSCSSSAVDLGDAAAAAAAVLAGAHIIRAHSIAAVLPAVRIADAILEGVARDEC
jgi:dihydropteroate synthase